MAGEDTSSARIMWEVIAKPAATGSLRAPTYYLVFLRPLLSAHLESLQQRMNHVIDLIMR